uniref:Secreted protein n=1 Tax=Neolamprologus brichardi TaxID=32507 RepID=A0A3Q4GX88_NEOBR
MPFSFLLLPPPSLTLSSILYSSLLLFPAPSFSSSSSSLFLFLLSVCLSLREEEDDDIAHQFCCPASECSSPSSR